MFRKLLVFLGLGLLIWAFARTLDERYRPLDLEEDAGPYNGQGN